MIRHGANVVFSAKDSMTSEEDIDDILKKGEKKVSVFTAPPTNHLLLCRRRSWMRR